MSASIKMKQIPKQQSPYEKLCHFMVKPWVVLLYVLLIFMSYQYMDKPIALYFHQLKDASFLSILKALTVLNKSVVCLSALFLLGLGFRFVYRHKRAEIRVWFLVLCVVSANILCSIAKIMLGRARPEMWFDSQLYGFHGFSLEDAFLSFPSGHTVTVMSLVFGLGALFPRYCYLLVVLGALFSCLRIVLTHHYLSDVLSATYLAMLSVWGVFYIARKKNLLTAVV